MLTPSDREAFDQVVDEVMETLPENLHQLLEEVPLVVEDAPNRRLMREMGIEFPDELCGLHDGIAMTERSVNDLPHTPDTITIYRLGIMNISADESGRIDPEELFNQVRITILHEIGHHFGLDEEQLEALGYD
ncbi:MAG: metallopeptidase family protein [Phycisphaeraceae bacterium]|nr:metallopeptidase family protein [Phycisphaeraceae bacterium]